ncbi:coiled-coil domain-containing protein 7 [Lutra lutra]|uniref:coiled-coil domain-containing protein 7 n=1 Tax=Lutra lutra TaxID=9657 RepID=UPI001FD570A2|nr:coiled-coil domain-containing protein 7 [Lutra lutra]
MKPAQHLLASSKKWANVPEFTYQKGLFNLPLSPKPKEKRSAKFVRDKLEPMVLGSPPTGESIVRYALPIPSNKTKELIAEDELIRKITKHLKMIVSTLEETYGFDIQNREKLVVKPENEELTFSVGDDLNSFLVCCSQFAAQLEAAAKEERNILESLFKWFQRQVNQMEEISKDQTFLEAECPIPDKTVTLSVAQVVKQVQKLEELKNLLKQRTKRSSRAPLSKAKDTENSPGTVHSNEVVQQIIEEFIKTHSTEEFRDVSATDPQTTFSLMSRLNVMLKIFEKQSNMLERAVSDQSLLEAKYKQMENNFQVLLEEKLGLESELQKLKNPEKTKSTYNRTKKTIKTEKKKDKGKPEDSEEKKSLVRELKIKGDLLEVQKVAHALEIENKFLQEQLKQAFQEAERAKHQLDYFLNQGKDSLKSEGKTKTKMEMGISKIKVEDSEDMPLERGTKKSVVTDSGGQETSSKLQEHLQISNVPNGSPLDKSSEKKRASSAISDLSQILKSQDGSAFLRNSSEVSADKDLSYILPLKTHDKSLTRLLSKEEIEDLLSAKTSLQGNETATASFISPPVLTKRKPMGSDLSKDAAVEEKLQNKTEKQTYQVSREFQAQDKVPDENIGLEDEAVSSTLMQMFTRMNRRHAFLVSQQKDMVSTTNQLPEGMALILRSLSQDKNLKSTRSECFDTHDDVPDKNLMLKHEDSKSKTEMQVKKQRSTRNETLIIHDNMTDGNPVLEHQESTSKIQLQVKEQKIAKGERLTTHNKVPENFMLEPQDSMSKTHLQVKKKRTSKGERVSIQDEVTDENHMLQHQDSISKSEIQVKKQRTHKRERLSTHDDVPDKNLVLKYQDSVSKHQIQVQKQVTSREKEHMTFDEVQDENLMLKHQDSVLETQVQKTSMEEILSTHFRVPDENLMLVSQDSVSKPQVQVEKKITHKRERRHTYFGAPDENPDVNPESASKFQVKVKKEITSKEGRRKTFPLEKQKHYMISHENLFPEEKVLFSRNQFQTKNEATRNMNLGTSISVAEKMDEKAGKNLSPEDNKVLISKGSSQIKTLGVASKAGFSNQDMDEPSGFTLENLELTSGYKDQHQTRGVYQSQRLSVKNEAASELSDTADRPAIYTSISDLIHQLDLNKVIETNIEHLKGVNGTHILLKEMKIQSKNLPEIDAEPLPGAMGRGMLKKEIKTQSKSHAGVNLFKDSYMYPQHKEDFFTSDIAPQEVSTNRISFSSFDNQGMNLFKNKNIFSNQQDLVPKNISMSKFPTKVINLSPFDNQEEPYEYTSPHVTEPPKANRRTSRAGSTIYKAIQLPSLNKEPSGHPKNSVSKKHVGFTNTLPAIISTTRKPIYEVPHPAARNLYHVPIFGKN